ncbi:MAG TPA: hypothetical protein VH741_04995, partial [Candidatus Limnocylindrales bacterium]
MTRQRSWRCATLACDGPPRRGSGSTSTKKASEELGCGCGGTSGVEIAHPLGIARPARALDDLLVLAGVLGQRT